MASSKHEAVWDWLQDCPYIGDLFFEAAAVRQGGTVLVPSDSLIEEYNDGSELHHYNCALTRFQPFSMDPNDMANIQTVTDLEDLQDWVRRQAIQRNFPEFPEDCTVEDIRVLPNESGYMVAQDFANAKYMIQFQVDYVIEYPEYDDEEESEDDDNG